MADMRFLRVLEVIERLKTTINGLDNRVGGADSFDSADDKAKLALPCLYVTLAPGTGIVDSLQTGLQQKIRHEFDIILHVDKTDRRGQYAMDLVVEMKMALLVSLAGWLPDSSLPTSESVNCNSTVLQYVDDGLLKEDRANLFWGFTFGQDYLFDSNDDGLGMIGDPEDLNNFDALDLDIILNEDPDVQDVQIRLTDIYESS